MGTIQLKRQIYFISQVHLLQGNQIHNFISSSGSGTVINYGSGSDFLTSYGSGSGSTRQKVTVPTVQVPVPQHWKKSAAGSGSVFWIRIRIHWPSQKSTGPESSRLKQSVSSAEILSMVGYRCQQKVYRTQASKKYPVLRPAKCILYHTQDDKVQLGCW